ncbi:MAG: type VI secretion system membrane subunit TssM [Rhodospirillaceae bacterium]|nr:type VI secretion system membrane subunit TssM [Rhodospirillaceae bacterium]
MRAVFRVLISGWFLSLIGVIILSLLVWFLGPLIAFADFAPLESALSRVLVIIVFFFIWVIALLIGMLRRRRANAKMARDLEETATGGSEPDAAGEEVAVLRGRLREALALLKKTKLGGGKRGRQYLYQLPWYLIIGPPGAGKTTAIEESGLRFPLDEQMGGRRKIKGVGGTRNCDWWFTDDAVMIDTAGRYTTQDSESAVDQGAWLGFLDMLRKHRRRQPINGVLVAISISDLMMLPEAERREHARKIRSRLRELDERLAIRFPVYVLFTKMDLVAGFVEFFEDLGKQDRREQVWGHTFPLEETKDSTSAVEQFPRAFDGLVTRLNDRVIERLHQEADPQRRSLVYSFPQQVASLRDSVTDFLSEIFLITRYERPLLLRGVYFTSGTQEGNPIDRLVGAMAATFGIGRQAVSGFSGAGRSYFLTRLLRQVIFPEASVVGRNHKLERRRRRLQWAAWATCGVVLLAMTALWTTSYFRNTSLIEDAERRVALYNSQVADLDLTEVSDPDLRPVLPPLATLRSMPGGYADRDASVPWLSGFGLYQGHKIGSQATYAYREALSDLFLPRLLLGLEEDLAETLHAAESGRSDDPEVQEELYSTLRVYLMLGGQGDLDDDVVRSFMTTAWTRQYAGLGDVETRGNLIAHLDAMLDLRRMGEVPLNGELIQRARTVLAEVPLAVRAFSVIRNTAEARALTPWRPIDAGGPATASVFYRASGDPLTAGIDGLYTRTGFYDYFVPTMIETAGAVASESWVLGQEERADLSEQQLALLERDVMQLYLDQYVTQWERMLADLRIRQFNGINDAVGTLNTLTGPNSPLRNLLTSASEQTQLSVLPPELATPEGAVEGVVSGNSLYALRNFAEYQARRRLSYNVATIGGVVLGGAVDGGNLGGALLGGGEEPEPLGSYVDRRFQPLHEFVSDANGVSQLEDLIDNLASLRVDLNRVADAAQFSGGSVGELIGTAGSGGAGGAIANLQLDAGQMPAPLGGWMDQVASGANTALIGGASNAIADAWNADVAELCVRATAGRYPFARGSSNDVSLADFAALFAPGGRIDTFFNANLARVVDTTGRTWTFRSVDGVDLGISSAVLAQFQAAHDIGEAFWPGGGGGTPNVQFSVALEQLSQTATGVNLTVGDTTLQFAHGRSPERNATWPGSANLARVAFFPEIAGGSAITREGAWAFFRLLDTASISGAGASDRFNVTFSAGGRQATFRLQAGSVRNPFNLPALRGFSCPSL